MCGAGSQASSFSTGSVPWLAVARCRLRQRGLHRDRRRPLCAGECDRHRSGACAADLCPHAPWPCPTEFREGNAIALPFAADAFDVAVMPLVIFFVPDPAAGVLEMARFVRPGGCVCAYNWDLTGGGFPYELAQQELRVLGVPVPEPPSKHAGSLDQLPVFSHGAGLIDLHTREITVVRTFESFDDYWTTLLGGPSLQRPLAALTPSARDDFQARLRQRLPADANGRITYSARATAIAGRVPR